MPDGEWDKPTLLGFEREMLGLYVSDHPLLGVEHVAGRGHRLLGRPQLLGSAAEDAERAATGRAGRRPAGHASAGSCPGCSGRSPGRATRGRRRPWRTWRARSRCCSSRPPTSSARSLLAEDAIVVVKGRLDRREDSPKLIAMEVTVPDLSVGGGGPFVVSMPVQRCVAPVVDRLQGGAAHPPGAGRGSPETLQWPADDGRPAR